MTARETKESIVEHIRDMRAYAISLARDGDMADDVVQDALVKAWTHFDSFQPGTNLRAWLITIVRNTFYTNIRKSAREQSLPSQQTPIVAEKPAHDGHLQLSEFRRAYEALSEDHREAIMLVGILGFTYEEASEACGAPVGTVKSRAARARAALAEKLDLDEVDMTDATTLAVMSTGSRPNHV